MLAGFVIQKTAGTLVNILWHRIMGYYPNLINNVGYKTIHNIKKSISIDKQKIAGGSKKYKNKTLKKRNKRKNKSIKNKITSKKRKKKKKKTKKSFKLYDF